jgi:hypothetical protein
MVLEGVKEERSFEIEILPAGRIPKAELRAKVNAAIEEAEKEFQKQHNISLEVSGTADGGLFGLGLAWPWVIHFGGHVVADLLYKAGEEAVKEVGKESGQTFYEMLKESLRKRNLTVSSPADLRLFPDPNHPYASLPPAPPPKPSRKKSGKKQSRKPKPAPARKITLRAPKKRKRR